MMFEDLTLMYKFFLNNKQQEQSHSMFEERIRVKNQEELGKRESERQKEVVSTLTRYGGLRGVRGDQKLVGVTLTFSP